MKYNKLFIFEYFKINLHLTIDPICYNAMIKKNSSFEIKRKT